MKVAMRRQPIILVGGGGHCRACIEVIESEGRFTIAGIVDRSELRGERVLGYEVVGCDDELAELVGRWKNALVTVGSIGTTSHRARLFDLLLARGAALPIIVAGGGQRRRSDWKELHHQHGELGGT
jgi:FlaA1/EpsC-like NDP-sugar epimerase